MKFIYYSEIKYQNFIPLNTKNMTILYQNSKNFGENQKL